MNRVCSVCRNYCQQSIVRCASWAIAWRGHAKLAPHVVLDGPGLKVDALHVLAQKKNVALAQSGLDIAVRLDKLMKVVKRDVAVRENDLRRVPERKSPSRVPLPR